MVIYFSGFLVLIIGLLALDLGVFHRKDEVMSTKEALGWTVFWIALSLLFNALVYLFYDNHWLGIGTEVGHITTGGEAALAFFTAYVVEKSLSIDNIFVIAMVFSYFHVPAAYQHRVLFWGILGALIMRGIMIAAGIAAIQQFSWLTYVLGGLLIVTAVKMMMTRQENLDPEKNPMIRLVEKWIPVTNKFHGHHFFIKQNAKWVATPLFLALVMIESTDLLFAVDSIPAVLAISLDPFIVFTSNVFAILGMRSLYFALAALMDRFRHLKTSLVFVLAFVGTKMILAHHVKIEPLASLGIIIGILSIGVIASLWATKEAPGAEKMPEPLPTEKNRMSRVTPQTVRTVFFLTAGSTVLIALAAIAIFPEHRVWAIVAGAALLLIEFLWARAWTKKIKAASRHAGRTRSRGAR